MEKMKFKIVKTTGGFVGMPGVEYAGKCKTTYDCLHEAEVEGMEGFGILLSKLCNFFRTSVVVDWHNKQIEVIDDYRE